MSEERIDRAPTDEPDGTTAYTASLQPPGGSVRPAFRRDVDDEEIAPDAAPADDDPSAGGTDGAARRGAGYDVGADSGDTDMYRPD
jgi:hypothetical protein